MRIFLSDPGNHNYLNRYQWINELIVEMDGQVPQFLDEVHNRPRALLRLIRAFQSDIEDASDFIASALNYFFDVTNIKLENYPEIKKRIDTFLTITQQELSSENFDYANDVRILKRVFNPNRGVVVNTCHGVKGEEFSVVIAFGLLHGYLPNWGEKDADASKKLLYVICSRAKKYLHLIAERGHSTRSGASYQTTHILNSVGFAYDAH